MPATLDARITIPARLKKLQMSDAIFSELCEISKASFSRLMNGTKALDGAQTEIFYKMLDGLEEMAQIFYPLSVDFSNVDAVKDWLKSPNMPALFKLLSDNVGKVNPSCLTVINALFENEKRLKEETEAIQKQAHDVWVEFLNEIDSLR